MHRLSFLLLFAVLSIYCSQWGGSNPVGVTGGSSTGYGDQSNNIPYDNLSLLVGSWKSIDDIESFEYIVFTFYANSQVKITLKSKTSEDDFSYWGSYEVNMDELILSIEDDTVVYSFFIVNDILYLTIGGRTSAFKRVASDY